ncbi:MAG: amidohydrolase [Planctomycetota bacterium]
MAPGPVPSLVLRNGVIATMDAVRLEAEAVAMAGDRIVAVGSNGEIEARVGPGTEVIDLDGAFAMPGFTEGHGHLMGLGRSLMRLRLLGSRSWGEVVAQVGEAARTTPKGEWILGRGWHQDAWEAVPQPSVEGLPLHYGLSEAAPDHPVLLRHASGHSVLANAKAMELAGIDRDTESPPTGRIVRDADGEPTGAFLEAAAGLVEEAYHEAMAALSDAERERLLRRQVEFATAECLARGVTSFHVAGASLATIELFRKVADEGGLGIRLYVMTTASDHELREALPELRLVGHADHRLTVRGIKRFIDGALGTRTAWMLQPYADQPGNAGLCMTEPDAIEATCRLAVEHGMQMCVHAIGDRANREMLDVYERVFRDHPQATDLRWRIEHAQHLHPDDIPRFARLGVIAAMQANHCTTDGAYAIAALGERRARQGTYAWRSLLDAGATLVNGTDAPVEPVDPLTSLHAAVTRRLADGSAFFPEQCMTRAEALRCYTLDAACAAFEEDLKGSLVPGKLADLVVLDRDLRACDEDEILATEVVRTVVGGVAHPSF